MNTENTYYSSEMELIERVSPEVADCIRQELKDQRKYLKMIASENYCSPSVQACMGNWMTDKYAEGYPYHRYYAGTDNVDKVEQFAIDKAKELFGSEHANVQPHSGSEANQQAYWAILSNKVMTPMVERFREMDGKPYKTLSDLPKDRWDEVRRACHSQRLLGMDYYSGGHLTHGYRMNNSAQLFDAYSYGVGADGWIDYDAIERMVVEVSPLVLLCGYSAYPRKVNFRTMREIADRHGCVLMVDMAHFAGLVAGKVFEGDYDPVRWADIVTTTTHKTLRGPRGGMILCKSWLAEDVDKGCPMTMGGPLPHVMCAKAVALVEASSESFREYAQGIVRNSKALADRLVKEGLTLQTGGTDNHMVLVDVSKLGLNGRQAESILRECGVTCNRNTLPNDVNGAWYTSGVRLGVQALTTLGMGVDEIDEIGGMVAEVLKNTKPVVKNGVPSKTKAKVDEEVKERARGTVERLLEEFKLYDGVEV